MNAKKQRKAEWKKEICVDDVDLAKAAMESGCFDSMELCSNLNEGGTTPSLGFITRCCEIRSELGSNVLFRVLIRCRSGDFCYSDEEMNVMIKDVIGLKELSEGGSTVSRTTTKIIHGIVFGVLKQGNEEVDLVKFRTLTNFAKPHFEVTFHRAIDVCVDYNKCMNSLGFFFYLLINLHTGFALLLEESNQIDRILTSFGKPTCDEVIKHQSLLNIDVLLDKCMLLRKNDV